MTARRKRLKKANRFPLLVLVLLALAYFVFANRQWDGSKLLVVYSNLDSVSIVSYDPVNEKITTVLIPAETQVEVAGGYGLWKLGSVGQLGKNEKIGSKLLTRTLQKYFAIPVYLTQDDLSPIDTAIIKIFSLTTPSLDKKEINLSDYLTLTKQTLKDGSEGYVLNRGLPNSILLIFSDPQISEAKANVALINASAKNINDSVGAVIETMGAKVSVSKNDTKQDFDCVVQGKAKIIVKIARVLECDQIKSTEGNFDATIKFGTQFAERF